MNVEWPSLPDVTEWFWIAIVGCSPGGSPDGKSFSKTIKVESDR